MDPWERFGTFAPIFLKFFNDQAYFLPSYCVAFVTATLEFLRNIVLNEVGVYSLKGAFFVGGIFCALISNELQLIRFLSIMNSLLFIVRCFAYNFFVSFLFSFFFHSFEKCYSFHNFCLIRKNYNDILNAYKFLFIGTC